MAEQSIVTMELDPTAIAGAFDGFVDALDRNLPIALKQASGFVSTHAKGNHPWKARTGFLDNSIRPLEPTGTFSNGDLGVDVISGGLFNVEYAVYVELGTKDEKGRRRNKPYPFMVPALDAQMPRIVNVIGQAVELSIAEAGL